MNFLALIIGLMVERLLTQLFHMREFHWLDPLFDRVFARLQGVSKLAAFAGMGLLTFVLVLPVGFLELALNDRFAHIPAFAFAIVILLFCLGPRDLVEEVDDYRAAIANDDRAELAELAKELLERTEADAAVTPDIECAIYAQANNRIFGVVFWFIVLGPAGAWLFRVLDLMRRRAVWHTEQADSGAPPMYVAAALLFHRILAWVPARLLMVGYALAGSYDGAVAAWRKTQPTGELLFPRADDTLLGAVGHGAATVTEQGVDPGSVSERARIAIELVIRTLWMIWCPALALLTLYDWIV